MFFAYKRYKKHREKKRQAAAMAGPTSEGVSQPSTYDGAAPYQTANNDPHSNFNPAVGHGGQTADNYEPGSRR
ncbi:hypothetical protein B0H13DRAFT_2338340 [Mycena leptocephala]|nr:hypothetical protein B0H13DRAFT_2338340 [Mycena leptocephala]